MSSYALINDLWARGVLAVLAVLAAAPQSARSSPESNFTESTISELKAPKYLMETLESALGSDPAKRCRSVFTRMSHRFICSVPMSEPAG